MGSFTEEDGSPFFDANDEIVSSFEGSSDSELDESGASGCVKFDLWVRNPGSVQERRSKFFKWVGLNVSENSSSEVSVHSSDFLSGLDRITSSDGAKLRSLSSEHEFSSGRSSLSSWSSHGSESSGEPSTSGESFECRSGNLDGAVDLIEDELTEVCTSRVIEPVEEASSQPRRTGMSLEPKFERNTNYSRSASEGGRKWWLRKLRSFSCVVEGQVESENLDSLVGSRIQKVKVRHSKKHAKELSALYSGQDIKAHDGSILTMRFSPDGKYLASAGEDGIIRVWKVVVDDRLSEVDFPDIDPSCVYFRMNNLSELKQLSVVEKDKNGKSKNLKRTSDSACVIVPPKVFRLLEKPIHEFSGHSGEILDLSWSHRNFLLSSSADKTVRLWQVGNNHCLKVFTHVNYVTCVQFSPVDDNYFVSGSIDGKIRIWDISQCQVSSWTDMKDIVTAVTYHPDGQGGVVGLLTGCCRFFNISDNQLQLEGQICIRNKKKSSCKRITSIEYFPHDSTKVMISCADSQVRILQGTNVIGKYKGIRNSGSSLFSASFTADGKHMISACEDSNVYMWNFANQENVDPSNARKVNSCERFQSPSTSIAIPWSGGMQNDRENRYPSAHSLVINPPSREQQFTDSYHNTKGCHQTWPEENLPPASSSSSHRRLASTLNRSDYKFLRTCHQSANSSNVWGLVIVTASWDGRIKSFHNYGLPSPQ